MPLLMQLMLLLGSFAPHWQVARTYQASLPPRPLPAEIGCQSAAWEHSQLQPVAGKLVHVSLAPLVSRLLSDAQAAGQPLVITSAYRSCLQQTQLRIQACGAGEYNLNQKPASQCQPPTEIAGQSLHQQGLAIDFACSGYHLFASSPCFRWLQQHGARYHLYNRQLEAWHWSTTAH